MFLCGYLLIKIVDEKMLELGDRVCQNWKNMLKIAPYFRF